MGLRGGMCRGLSLSLFGGVGGFMGLKSPILLVPVFEMRGEVGHVILAYLLIISGEGFRWIERRSSLCSAACSV